MREENVTTQQVRAGSRRGPASPDRSRRPLSDSVEHVGVVDPARRKTLLARAKATLTPSVFVEPFCGVHVESMLSGTPVITSDNGAFVEYNLHGTTGYRCRTFEHFTWAARNFSLDGIGEMDDEYFYSVSNVYSGKGWYEPNPGRTDLDWLTKYPPEPG